MSRRHPFIRFVQFAEDYAYRNADRVVSLLPYAEPYMKTRGLSQGKFTYIPNGVDVQERSDMVELPELHIKVLAQLREKKRFIVGYAGAHGIANSLNTLLEAAEKLQDEPVGIVLVGKGPEKAALQQTCADRNITNVFFLTPVEKRSVPALLEKMDVLYIGLKSQPLFRFGVSPNKLFDYMMSEKPIIQAIEAANDIVGESGCGLSIPPENPTALASSILALMKMSQDEREALGVRGRTYVLANHDYEVLARTFLDCVRAESLDPRPES